MNLLKELVTTLVTALIFITAIELISPNNGMKKYLKFILGLVLITIILNPIVKIISSGQNNIYDSISNYEDVLSNYQNQIKSSEENELKDGDLRKQAFEENFNKNCESVLKSQYPNKKFKSDVECTVNFNSMIFDIKKIKVGISEKSVSKIKKVIINKNDKSYDDNQNSQYKEVVTFISEQLDIPKEKIEVYKIEE
ncbi:stage III sporulation protein AF [Clostridium botulinum]|uniref:Stage III sporulation protein AF n=1 Tax=Clostridium botulinum TaxID=1491 RepID=A0A6B4QKR1_CLOBO|nr:stage III sporulation protein AF [Clostridium botulinum]EES48698.1 stage III sporulation protein AF [Clostridium botulinum E1 str. 'BoNT E Beluga']KAI3350566.1 stage III sporulation protein AF [Clostridium botulinum]KOM86910.1 stage III sporulation protein AF [Clostridium botulinum]MBN1074815.1 stage III sporulation protein AF [Clostridium botulinum]MBY6760465.1 stage III sporulation protein AF [Clostridium botulinum]